MCSPFKMSIDMIPVTQSLVLFIYSCLVSNFTNYRIHYVLSYISKLLMN